MALKVYPRTVLMPVKVIITKLTNTQFSKKAVSAFVAQQSHMRSFIVNVACHAKEIIPITVEDQAILPLSLNNTDQRCLYGTEESLDLRELNETTIVADDNDASDYKNCWAKFTCPKGYKVQYYFHYFETYYNSAVPAVVYLYYNPMNEIIQYFGSGSQKTRPVLFEWIDTKYHQLRFEFRTYYTKRNLRGFKMRLRCEIDQKL